MNRLHLLTFIQRCALHDGDTDENAVYGKVRKSFPGAVNDGDKELMGRAECQAVAKQSIDMVRNSRFPIERARLALDIREGELRADVLDAIALLDVSNPRDCRDVFELHSKVGGSIGEPTLREALDMLAEAGQDTTPLKARCDEIFPPAPDED